MVRALSAIHVVLAAEAANVCALIQWYHRVLTGAVALLAAWDELFACLAAKLSQPVALVTSTGAVAILSHVRERIIAEDAFAVALLDTSNLFLHDLQEITLALGALVAA